MNALNMDSRIIGYREVIPEQLQQDKWKEITLNTGKIFYITLKFVDQKLCMTKFLEHIIK